MTDPPSDRHIPDLVSLREAADIMGVSKQYAHRLVVRGQLVGKRVDGAWVFRRVVVERMPKALHANERPGAQPTE